MRLVLHDYGGYAFSLQLAEYLARKGNHVTYLHGGVMQTVQRARRVSRQTNLRIESTETAEAFEKYSFFRRWMQEREYGARLGKRIVQIAPDVVISANAPLDAQAKVWQATRQIHARFVFWWQDVISLAVGDLLKYKYGPAAGLISAYYQSKERGLLRHADCVIAISEAFLPIARAWGMPRRKISVIPNWAPLDEISVMPKDNRWLHAHGLQGKFVFLYAGILGLKHDPHVFVTLSRCFEDTSDVEVVVVGEGPGAIWLTKFQPFEDFSRMLASAEVLLATLKEQTATYSVPSKVLSYLCAARPVLLAAEPTSPAARAAEKYDYGRSARPDDTAGLCALARELYNSKDLRTRLGVNARKYAQSAFDIDRIGGQFLELLQ
jgi:colanic acid biosynthesis glycosyl transferase WcaI